ncbi:hypothetical protein [Halosegnis marinus]|uniref:IS256 family transposase n=1 Tax=Halosegnis marinus TaxID=3034023 RepID=A0ABD5ZTJ1_9EURY|nr:hypothetical protein [Halosegnis sp. DT85]
MSDTPVEEAFVSDRIEDALDCGTVDALAREHLLGALAELDAERARARREGNHRTIRGP